MICNVQKKKTFRSLKSIIFVRYSRAIVCAVTPSAAFVNYSCVIVKRRFRTVALHQVFRTNRKAIESNFYIYIEGACGLISTNCNMSYKTDIDDNRDDSHQTLQVCKRIGVPRGSNHFPLRFSHESYTCRWS